MLLHTRPAILMRLLLAFTVIGLLSSCYNDIPWAGGSVHVPPDGISANQPTELEITFSVWGREITSNLDKHFTDVTCYYMTPEMLRYEGITGEVVRVDNKEMEMRFIIPPLDLRKGETVKYYFEMLFDGTKNTDSTITLVVK